VLDETRIRLDAIHFVRALRERWVAVPTSELRRFSTHLKGQTGIFKPAELTEPLSITTTIDNKHAQDTIEGSRVLYDYVSREHENDALKRCAEAELPLIYFLQVKKRPTIEYIVFAPVYVVGWNDESRCFVVDLSEQKPGEIVSPAPLRRQLPLPVMRTPESPSEIRELTRSYAVSTVQRRLYEARFRNAVLDAYGDRCAVCRLHIRPLLDAAHVTADREPKPAIDVREGIALCATHHRAFDANILRYDNEYRIHITVPDRSGDGEEAMLLVFDGRELHLPSDEDQWPAHPGIAAAPAPFAGS
jgi:putative restriction endonuclease